MWIKYKKVNEVMINTKNINCDSKRTSIRRMRSYTKGVLQGIGELPQQAKNRVVSNRKQLYFA